MTTKSHELKHIRLDIGGLAEADAADFKKAKGIATGHRERTNTMLAERDYDVPCDLDHAPIMVVHGLWVWWCKSHHTLHDKCITERYKKKTVEVLKAIRAVDKTLPYYPNRENAEGALPVVGAAWATPADIARSFIADINKN